MAAGWSLVAWAITGTVYKPGLLVPVAMALAVHWYLHRNPWRRQWSDAWLNISRLHALRSIGHEDKCRAFYAECAKLLGLEAP